MAADANGHAIVAEGLTRTFGRVKALDGFTATFPWGRVSGLVGPNGSGKTTLLLVLAGLLSPDSGTALVAAADPATHPYLVHGAVGWMPDFFGVYDDLTPREYLELFAAAYRMPPSEARERAAELLALLRFESLADAPVHTMSRGQKQKLGFARALVHSPRVLLLDEPAAGLDPRARVELRDLVRAEADRGVAVVISSHILSELEEMADVVVFVERGRCRGTHPLTDLPAQAEARPWRIKALDPGALRAALAKAAAAFEDASGGAVVRVASEVEAAELLALLVAEGVRVVAFAPERGGLEAAFLELDG